MPFLFPSFNLWSGILSSLFIWSLEAPPGRKALVFAKANPFLMLGVEGATVRPITGRTTQKGSPLFLTHTKTVFVFVPTLELYDNPGIVRSFSQVQKLGSRHME